MVEIIGDFFKLFIFCICGPNFRCAFPNFFNFRADLRFNFLRDTVSLIVRTIVCSKLGKSFYW